MPPNAFRNFRKKAAEVKKTPEWEDRDPWDFDNYKMDIDEPSARGRIIDPGENGFFMANHHRVKSRDRRCTSDIPVFDGKCVYCYFYDRAGRDDEDRKNLYPRFRSYLEMMDYRYFHIVEETGKNNKKRKVGKRCASDDRVPKFRRGRSCKYCSSKDREVSARYFGGRKKWDQSDKGMEPLVTLNEELMASAIDSKGNLYTAITIGFLCAECGEYCILEWDGEERDVDEDLITTIVNAEEGLRLEEWTQEEYLCPKCERTALPLEVWIAIDDADNEVQSTDENPIRRRTMFDMSLKITCSGKLSRDGSKTYRDYNFNADAFPSMSLIDELEEHGCDEKEIDELLTPVDFEHLLRPEYVDRDKFDNDEAYVQAVLKAQAKVLERDNPFEEQPTTERSRAFNRSRFRRR